MNRYQKYERKDGTGVTCPDTSPWALAVVERCKWGERLNAFRWQRTLDLARSPVLDFGCGAGAYVRALLDAGYDAIGVDIAEYPAWQESVPAHFARIGSGTELPFMDGAFDSTLCFEVLEHLTNPREVLRELMRVTRHQILISVPNCTDERAYRLADLVPMHFVDRTHCSFFTASGLTEMLSEEGLDVRVMIPYRELQYEWLVFDNYPILRLLRPLFFRSRKLLTKLHLRRPLYGSLFVVCEVRL